MKILNCVPGLVIHEEEDEETKDKRHASTRHRRASLPGGAPASALPSKLIKNLSPRKRNVSGPTFNQGRCSPLLQRARDAERPKPEIRAVFRTHPANRSANEEPISRIIKVDDQPWSWRPGGPGDGLPQVDEHEASLAKEPITRILVREEFKIRNPPLTGWDTTSQDPQREIDRYFCSHHFKVRTEHLSLFQLRRGGAGRVYETDCRIIFYAKNLYIL